METFNANRPHTPHTVPMKRRERSMSPNEQNDALENLMVKKRKIEEDT